MAPQTVSSTETETEMQSLWDQAFDSLSADLKMTLGKATTHKRDIVAAVLEAAENRKATSLRKRWKFKRSNGEIVIVRDVLEKIAKWINCFKAVGDTAVQFDASNASLPWAAVRLLLQITVNDVQQYGSMVQDLEVVSRIIARYKEFERLHLGRDQVAEPALETALAVLYTEVLNFLANTIDFFSQSTTVRLAKSVFWTGDDGVEKILSREDEVLKLAKLQDTSDLRFIETTVLRLKDEMSNNTKRIDEENTIKMISWLSTSPFSIHHDTISHSRTPNFGDWLLRHENYRRWCESSSSSTLWLHGITGSGKTHLFSVVVDSLLAIRDSNHHSTPFAYFYCLKHGSEPERSSADGILRSILRQLTIKETQSDVRDFLFSDFEHRSKSALLQGLDLPRLRKKECVDRIIQVAGEDPITILLDGVDQVDDEDCNSLLECLTEVTSKAENVVKVLVTSRNSLDVLSGIPKASEIVITADQARSDMSRFILQKINDAKLVGGRVSPNVKDSVTKALLDGAGEMFLWANLQIQQLRKVKNEDDLLPSLQSNILSDLDKLYENDLTQILHSGDISRQLAIQILSWLLYMRTPLSPEALLVAISTSSINGTSYTAADVSALCSNLVIMDLDRQVVRLAHNSIREYILRAHQSLFSASVAHSLLASTCMRASSRGPPSNGNLELQPKDFFFYSATYWANHFENAKVVERDEDLFQEMISFVFEDEDYEVSLSFESWLDICQEIASILPRDHPMVPALGAIPNKTSSPLFLAATFGIDGLLTLLTESATETDWNQRNNLNHTAIYLAAAFGHLSTITSLIEKGVELNVECGAYGSPLHVACFRGYEEIVAKLLQHGASPNCGSKFKSAIHAASQGQHEDIVLALTRHNSTITCDEDYEQAIQLATEYGFIKVIEELQKPTFKSFIDYGTPDKHKKRVAKAIKGGQLFVLQRQLCKEKADISTVFPGDAVAIASLYGYRDIVKYLLDLGMDIEAEGQFGSPLRSASLMNHKSTVEELIRHGANVKTAEYRGNALYVAAVKGHSAVVRILLDEGADVHLKTGSLGTVLQAAAYHGHKVIVENLLDAGASIYADGSYTDAFHAAADGGHQEIIMLLLERGYQPERRLGGPAAAFGAPYRRTLPGWHYIRSGTSVKTKVSGWSTQVEMDDVAEFFEGRSGERLQQYDRKNRLLELSAANGRVEVMEVLLAQTKSLRISSDEVRAALKAAAHNGQLGAIKLLLNSMSTKGLILESIYAILERLPDEHRHILEYVFAKAYESGCTEGEVDRLRLKLPAGREKYKVASIDPALLRKDFLNCCASGNQIVLEAILTCNHQNLLQRADLIKGLKIAAYRGRALLLKTLFDNRPEIQNFVITDDALISAAGRDLETLKILFSRGKDLQNSPLLLSRAMGAACTKGQSHIIEYLVSHFDVDLDIDIPEALKPLRMQQRETYGYELSSDEADSSDTGRSDTDSLDVHSLDIHSSDTDNSNFVSPLQAALGTFQASEDRYCRLNSETVVRTLLKLGADPNSLGGKQYFPLEFAARFCPDMVVNELLEAGADVDMRSKGDSALMGVFKREMEAMPILQRLLDAGYLLPDYHEEGMKLLDTALGFFESGREQGMLSYSEGLDCCFLQAPSLDYVFEQGTGAVIEFLLQMYDTGKLEDVRYSLILQMICLLGKTPFIELLLSRGVDVDATGHHYGSSVQAAALTGQTETVKLLLERGANPNILQGHWQTALRAGVAGGHEEVVQLLLCHGADPRLRYSHEKSGSPSILQFALQEGHTAIAKLLLESDTTLIDEEGGLQHPLIICCLKGYHTIVDLLLRANASVNVQSHQEHYFRTQNASPLHAAIAGGHVDIVEKLLSKGANVNMVADGCHCETPLLAAIDNGDVRIVRLLLTAGANTENALQMAVRQKDSLQVVKELVATGARVDNSSLQEACENGNLASVDFLLESLYSHNKNPSSIIDQTLEALTTGCISNYTSVYSNDRRARIKRCDPRILGLLLDHVPSTPKRFLRICSSGSANLVNSMIKQGMDVNGSDGGKESPLQAACRSLNFEVVQQLLQSGAIIQPKLSQPEQPLVLALRACASPILEVLEYEEIRDWEFVVTRVRLDCVTKKTCADIVRILLEHGAGVDGLGEEFESPLQLSCLIGDLSITRLLIAHGASVDKFTGYTKTPLFAAILGNNTDIISLILEKGVDINYVHSTVGTPLHLACLFHDEPLAVQLLQQGASPAIKNASGETALTVALQNASSWRESLQLPRVIYQNSTNLKASDEDIVNVAHMEDGDMLSSLLAAREQPVSQDVIVRFLERGLGWQKTLEILFDHSNGLGITPKMLMVGLSEYDFHSLIRVRQLSCEITSEVLESQTDIATLKALVEYQPDVEITEGVIIKVLSLDICDRRGEDDDEFLWSIWPKDSLLKVTQQMLKAASSLSKLQFLLERMGQAHGELQDVALAICEKHYFRDQADMLTCVLEADPEIELTASQIENAMTQSDSNTALDVVLTFMPSLHITEEMFLTRFGSHLFGKEKNRDELAEVLRRHNKKIVFTQKIGDAIDRAYHSDTDLQRKELFYSLRERDETQEEADARQLAAKAFQARWSEADRLVPVARSYIGHAVGFV